MFYPVESLKRGGRFYLCWVADSWPLRFAATTHRQLWAQDIRKLCDDLMEVVTNESGRPTSRFSLRLSSQLMRGLVRLYERKVTVLLSELCMINANVFKHSNKKFSAQEVAARPLRRLPPAAVVVPEEPETEQRLEEMIQNSGNAVVNIQDITLKEATIPDFQLPANDGFGEEHPNQALQQLLGRSVEMMLADQSHVAGVSGASGVGPLLDATARNLEEVSLAVPSRTLERVSDHDVTMFGKSAAGEVLEREFEKDIPEIPEIPPPAMPAPQPEMPTEAQRAEAQPALFESPKRVPEVAVADVPDVQVAVADVPDVQVAVADVPAVQLPQEPMPVVPQREPEVIELEELEEGRVVQKRRRGKGRLLIDKRTKLSSTFLKSRIDNIHVEQRCEDFSLDIADTRVPVALYWRRPCAGGIRGDSRLSLSLLRMFQRGLSVAQSVPLADRELKELETEAPRQRTTRSVKQTIQVQQDEPVPMEVDPRHATANMTEVNVTEFQQMVPTEDVIHHVVPEVVVDPPIVDISEMLTQKLETVSRGRKRTAELDSPLKRQKSGYVSFRESQQMQREPREQVPDKENVPPPEENILENIQGNVQELTMNVQNIQELTMNVQENIQGNVQENIQGNVQEVTMNVQDNIQEVTATVPIAREAIDVSTMLSQAGLADMEPIRRETTSPTQRSSAREGPQAAQAPRGKDSEGSETPLGSLDRTKVSLGDSVRTTDSQRYIRRHWGIEGTMLKIMTMLKRGGSRVTVETLVARGPVVQGCVSVIAARCFFSVLKLKQHGFIRVAKVPETSAILDISLGPKFDGI